MCKEYCGALERVVIVQGGGAGCRVVNRSDKGPEVGNYFPFGIAMMNALQCAKELLSNMSVELSGVGRYPMVEFTRIANRNNCPSGLSVTGSKD